MSDEDRAAPEAMSDVRPDRLAEELAEFARELAAVGAVEAAGAAKALHELADELSWASEAATGGGDVGGDHPAQGRNDSTGEGAQTESADAPNDLDRRLHELKACVDEVADLLEGGLERLETLEMQLGDPDDDVDARLSAGVAECRDILAGIEGRLAQASRSESPMPMGDVLVVDDDCDRRCRLCLTLEREGFAVSAAVDADSAARLLAKRPISAAIVSARIAADPDALVTARGTVAILTLEGDPSSSSRAEGERRLCGNESGAELVGALVHAVRERAAPAAPSLFAAREE